MNTGVTLIELIVVILIIAILSALGLSQFGPAKERALDKEGVASLKLIQAAEKIYRMENYPRYYPAALNPPYLSEPSAANINSYLKLSLPTDARRNWNYTAQSTGDATADRCPSQPCTPTRTWSLSINAEDPSCAPGTGPCY